jgi:predicted AAA+ superfamily ATPase
MNEGNYRLDYDGCRRLLLDRLREPAPGRIQLLTGPRQVGKTTLLLDLAEHLGEAAHYVAADDPQAGLPGFWERVWTEAETRASRGGGALFIDEIQHIADWAARIKAQYDRLRRRKIRLHVVATGSSALRLGAGSRESLAGRFERLTLTHWSALTLMERFKLAPSASTLLTVRLGSYPGSLQFQNDIPRWRAYVRDSIIEPAIGKDVLALGVVRRPGLLRQIFAVAISMPAQIVSLQKLQGQLHDRGALETVAHYLALLEEAYLVAPLRKFGAREHRQRAAPPKLVALNNALPSALHPQGPPDPSREPARFGSWVENACLAFAWNSGQRVTYWREEPLEVDGIIDGSWGAWAVEVKTGAFDSSQLRGLLEFCRRHPRYRPLVVTAPGDESLAGRLGVACINWSDFLLSGPGKIVRGGVL